MLDKQQPKLSRTIALLAFLGTPSMLFSSNSQGAVLAGGLALLTSVIPFLLRRLDLTTRNLVLCSAAFVGFVALGVPLGVR